MFSELAHIDCHLGSWGVSLLAKLPISTTRADIGQRGGGPGVEEAVGALLGLTRVKNSYAASRVFREGSLHPVVVLEELPR